jgi:putative membrane protein
MLSRPLTRLTILVALLSAGAIPVASAQTAEPAKPAAGRPQPASAGVDTAGRKFLTDAAMGGMTEVEAGELAAHKAVQNDVKGFAERMVKDHGNANEELKRIAAAKGVELPQKLDRKHRSDLERLEKLSGPDFDRAYMKYMLEDHQKDVAAFRKAARNLKDPDVKHLASSTLPTLEEHLKMAEKASQSIKSAGVSAR